MLFEILLLGKVLPFMTTEVISPRPMRSFNREEISLQFPDLFDDEKAAPEASLIFDGEGDPPEVLRKGEIPLSEELSIACSWTSVEYSERSGGDRNAAVASRCSSRCGFLKLLHLVLTIYDVRKHVLRARSILQAALNLILMDRVDISIEPLDYRKNPQTYISERPWTSEVPKTIYHLCKIRRAWYDSHENNKPTSSSHWW